MKKKISQQANAKENLHLIRQIGQTKYGRLSEIAAILFPNSKQPYHSLKVRQGITNEELHEVVQTLRNRYPEDMKLQSFFEKINKDLFAKVR